MKTQRSNRTRHCSCMLSVLLLAVTAFMGCAKTNVTNRERLVYERLPRPARIYVYDFSASPTDVARDSELAGQAATVPPGVVVELITTVLVFRAFLGTSCM